MQKYIHLLERLGLNPHEQKVYLALLMKPYMTVSEIARSVGIHRPMVYKSLASLEGDSLVEKSYLDGKRYHYHVTSPNHLRAKLENIETLARMTLPELELLYKKHSDAPVLSVKEGIEGIRTIHRDIVTTTPKHGIYYRYSSSRDTYSGKSIYVDEGYEELQKKKGLERITITSEIQGRKRTSDPNRKVLIIPKEIDPFDDNISKIIYKDKVAFIDYESQTGWIVESPRYARYEQKLFQLLSKFLEK